MDTIQALERALIELTRERKERVARCPECTYSQPCKTHQQKAEILDKAQTAMARALFILRGN